MTDCRDNRTAFVSLCSEFLGGAYRSDGAILRACLKQGRPTAFQQCTNIVERTHLRVRHYEVRRQRNLEAVIALVSSRIEAKIPGDKLDADWVSTFFECAMNASSRYLQTLFASAMHAELRRPGSISRRSLEFLASCDPWELMAFRKIAKFAFIGKNGHPFVFRATPNTEGEDVIFSEEKMMILCAGAGMVSPEPAPIPVGFTFRHRQANLVIADTPFSGKQNASYLVQRFTKIGSDIYRVMSETQPHNRSSWRQKRVLSQLRCVLETA